MIVTIAILIISYQFISTEPEKYIVPKPDYSGKQMFLK